MKLGILGLGHWGQNYVRVLTELRVEDLTLSDVDSNRLKELGERHPGLATSPDPWRVIEDPEIEGLVIATPASSHFELAAAALENGKHVLVEKPMALRSKEAHELVELAARRERILMVGHTFLYNDSVRKLRELVKAPESGSVYYVTARRTHLGLIRSDVSALWDVAPHDLSVLFHLLDESPVWVSAVEGRFLRDDVGDTAFVSLGFASGAVAHVEASWVDAHKVREIVVVTSRRRIVFNDLDLMESLRIYEKGVTTDADARSFGEFQYLLRDGDIISPRVQKREPLRNLCTQFLECVATGAEPLSGGALGLRVVETLAAAERSTRRRGAPEEITE